MKGLIRCGTCGASMGVLSYGKARQRLTYACTRSGCGSASMATEKVERAVAGFVYDAIMSNEPHVAAALADDDRYERALTEVERAREALAEYRDDVELQQVLGVRDFAAGLRVRREAVEAARRALRETPRPEPIPDAERQLALPVRRVVAEVRVFPRSAPDRLTLRWHGADEHVPVVDAPAAPAEAAAA